MASFHTAAWLLSLIAAVVWFGASYLLVIIVYNTIFHPLARYPGPFWARISPVYALYHAYYANLHRNIQRCHETYGPVVRYSPNGLVFNNVEALRDIYGHGRNTQKSMAYAPLPQSTLNIHNCVDTKTHGRKRRIISQSFAAVAVSSYEPTMVGHVRNLCKTLLATAEVGWPLINKDGWSPPQDIFSWSNYLSLDVISDLTYSQPFNLVTKRDLRWVVDAVIRNNCCDSLRATFPTIFNHDLFKWYNPIKLFFPTLADDWLRLSKVSANFVEERTRSRDKVVDRNDIIFTLFAAHDPKTGDKLTDIEVLDQAHRMVAAGATTATAISSTLSYLSRHADAYSRLTEEIHTTFPSLEYIRQGPLLTSCHYLRACIDEAMRLASPTRGVSWHKVGPGGAAINGEHIPEGYEVAVDLWAIHHNPDYFPDPFVFNPDRFMPKSVEREPTLNKPKFDFFPMSRANTIFPTSPSALSPNSFQGMYFPSSPECKENKAFAPFSLGPRSCVGKPLAYLEMSLALASIVWCMDFRAADGMEDWEDDLPGVDMFARSRKGPVLQFRRREGVEI